MKLIRQLIEYLDSEDMLTDEFYHRLVSLGWIRPTYLNGRVAKRSELSELWDQSIQDEDIYGRYEDIYGPYMKEDGDAETTGKTLRPGGGGGKRGAVRERQQDDRAHLHERRRVFREIGAALAQADIPASPELAGLRALSARLGAASPWMRPLLEASEAALDEALLGAMNAGDPSAASLLSALSSSACRFPLTDPRWSRYPGVLRAYEAVVSGSDAASLQRTARGQAWILREKGMVTAHEVSRAQQRVLDSLSRVMSHAPETVERWLAASGHGKYSKVVDLGEGVTLELLWIPPGTFLMGSPEDEQNRCDWEGPQHEVTFRRGFWLGKYPVTQAQWEVVMGNNPSWFKGDGRLPVEEVSWEDCQEFITKLNGKMEGAFRLPSEAEWEYACRAGTTIPFYFGETISTGQANYNGNYTYGAGKKGVYRGKTTPVGSFPANAWGLYDMHGNVWEWCEDDWHTYAGAPDDGSAWVRIRRGSYRVDRGGCWNDDPRYCRSAYRNWHTPENRSPRLGFRLARSSGAWPDGRN